MHERYKHYSLFVQSVSSEEEKGFITLAPGINVKKLFFFVADDEAK